MGAKEMFGVPERNQPTGIAARSAKKSNPFHDCRICVHTCTRRQQLPNSTIPRYSHVGYANRCVGNARARARALMYINAPMEHNKFPNAIAKRSFIVIFN